MKDKKLKQIISSDKFNLLQDKESDIAYFFIKLRYRIELFFKNYKL